MIEWSDPGILGFLLDVRIWNFRDATALTRPPIQLWLHHLLGRRFISATLDIALHSKKIFQLHYQQVVLPGSSASEM